MSKQREALELALEAIKNPIRFGAVRLEAICDEIREALAEPEQELEFWPGEILICKEDDSKVTVVNGNRGSLQLMNGKIAIAWNDSVGGEYTIEQIKEMFYRTEKPEQKPVAVVASQTGDPVTMSWHHEPALPIGTKLYTAPPARKPLTDEEISTIVQSMSSYTWDAHMLARAIERAHGIGEE